MPVLALALVLQLSILFGYLNASLSYPYSYPPRPIAASRYMAGMLITGNHSLIHCDDETAFWASFQLPSTFGREALEHGRTYDCADPLWLPLVGRPLPRPAHFVRGALFYRDG